MFLKYFIAFQSASRYDFNLKIHHKQAILFIGFLVPWHFSNCLLAVFYFSFISLKE